jgi:EmrB/QacA subfamily drug resistance transporter
LCAVAPSIELLVAGRALQGAFGALLTPSALAVIIAAFPPDERGAAIGSWTAWSAISTVIGPLAGGYLVDAVSWRLIFAINVPFVLFTLVLISLAVPARERGLAHARVDWLGAALTCLGLAGPVLALIRQPLVGWSNPEVWGSGLGGLALLGLFLVHERRTPEPMLPLALFRRRNFAVGNVQTFVMYAGLSVTFFFLVLFLQEVAGYGALQAGLALMPATLVMFALSKRVGRLADRIGPRLFMGLGPLTAAAGLGLMLRIDAELDYFTDLLPALVIFSVGLSLTVAPLTATVLSDADESNAGIASGINNAIARIAGLLAVAAVGAIVSAQFAATLDSRLGDRPLAAPARAAVAQARRQTLARVDPARAGPEVARAVRDSSVHAFRVGLGISAVLVAFGGLLGLVGIRNPRREVSCAGCAGGQFAGQPEEVALAHAA